MPGLARRGQHPPLVRTVRRARKPRSPVHMGFRSPSTMMALGPSNQPIFTPETRCQDPLTEKGPLKGFTKTQPDADAPCSTSGQEGLFLDSRTWGVGGGRRFLLEAQALLAL